MGGHELFIPSETLRPKGLLVLVSGPTGVGKDEVLAHLVLPHQRIVTHTTRPSGLFEREGNDYHFTNSHRFEEMIQREEMFEYYQNDRGIYYGTSKKEINQKRESGLTVWRLNPDGVFGILDDPQKREFLEPLAVFFLVADLKEVGQRIRERGREKGWESILRTGQAYKEMCFIDRKIQAENEDQMVRRRLEPVFDERILFHNSHSWVDNPDLIPESRVALQVVENRQGFENPDGFPRTMRIVEDTITCLQHQWNLA